ncbi:MFS transporter [Paramicrobacterium agarici]|uniref:MHS family proline/betaine transporter-like MFS transporter n=1 Tax=Paramicrobacterium agarici TaxID=630514 RepID=A0A2A9E042_9MICO|nr:MFS transporter [Microbacterium agarici]PFG31951.1 MHS family proline/betaine transporter-like MFS transporter [Microbacterium agarici]
MTRNPGHTAFNGPLETGSITVVKRRQLRRTVLGTFVGNVMEWYDVGVFGYLIVTLGPVFLPEADPATQVVFMLGTFASTYILRPLGGLFFGWLGDKIGRKRVLFITLTLVAGATFAIGLLPTYAVIGVVGSILLVLLKMVQGFSAGGEFTGAVAFISESSPDKKRGFYAAFLDAGSYLGFALGAGIVTALQVIFGQQAMLDGLWRAPFLIAGPVGLIAIYLRLRVEESPQFTALLKQSSARATTGGLRVNPLRAFAENWRAMLMVIVLVAAANSAGYAFTSYMPTYLSTVLEHDAVQSNLISLPLLLLMACSMPFVGMLSDRVGRKPVLFAASIWVIVLSVPAFALLGSGSLGGTVSGLALIGVPVALYMGTLASTYPALFPTNSRTTNLGVSYNISIAIFGGTAPLVIDALIRATGNEFAAAFYLIGMSVVGLVAVIILRESARQPLKGSEPNVETEREAHILNAERSGRG